MDEEKETQWSVKIPLEGGRLRGVIVLDVLVTDITITIDDGKRMYSEYYKLGKLDNRIPIYKKNNAKFTLSSSVTTIKEG